MNICFIGNGNKTLLFKAIAKDLRVHGFKIFWILPSDRILENEEKKLVLTKSIDSSNVDSKELLKYIDVVSSDRILCHDINSGKRKSVVWANKIDGFLRANMISVCFGEITHAYEIITYRISKSLGIQYLCPHTVRYPIGRFGFFSDEYLSKLFKGSNSENLLQIHQIFQEKPDYFYPHQNSQKKTLNILGFLQRDSSNIQLLPIGYSWVKWQIKLLFFRMLNLLFVDDNFESSSKNIAYFYHVQPEASIDVSARYQEDQTKIVEALARRASQYDSLIVKLHPNASNSDLLRLFRLKKRFSNIRLVKAGLSSNDLIDRVGLVISCTGTVTLEAQNLGKPSANLVGTIFSNYGNVRVINVWDRDLNLQELFNSELIDIRDYINEITRRSYRGIIDTPDRIAGVDSGENLCLLVSAFLDVLKSLECKSLV